MKIKMSNLYGAKDQGSYYRKQGTYCFDFVWDINYASDLTETECKGIIDHADWYCKQYGAAKLEVVE